MAASGFSCSMWDLSLKCTGFSLVVVTGRGVGWLSCPEAHGGFSSPIRTRISPALKDRFLTTGPPKATFLEKTSKALGNVTPAYCSGLVSDSFPSTPPLQFSMSNTVGSSDTNTTSCPDLAHPLLPAARYWASFLTAWSQGLSLLSGELSVLPSAPLPNTCHSALRFFSKSPCLTCLSASPSGTQ